MRGTVTVHMDAPSEKIWDLIADVTKIGLFSPETFEAEWLDGATEAAKGVRFRGHVKRNGKGPIYWATCAILECDEPKTFSFGVGPNPEQPWNIWRYELKATPNGGTTVTESFQLANRPGFRIYWAVLGWARGKTNRDGMTQTLNRMKEVAEKPAS